MEPVEEYRLGEEILRIYVEENPESPRHWDNLGKIIGWHRRYNIGDGNPFSTPNDFYIWLKTHPSIVLNLYMFDHSGLMFNTSGFSDPWDSMQVGYIYVELNRIRSEYGKKHISKKTVEAVRRVLQSEVEVYNQYVNGEVYGFTLEKVFTCGRCREEHSETVDSCWGFYGDVDPRKNGMIDHLPERWQKFLQAQKAIAACICEKSDCLREQE
ncbi:MAG: hypothetical protein ACQCN4_02510 [Candidatus Bathyarchaeia archaeon]|jgi:hypothetical protein